MTQSHQFSRKLLLQVILPVLILMTGLKLAIDLNQSSVSSNSYSTSKQSIELARCLKNTGWTMYGESSCKYCQQQKEILGVAFSEINYIECSVQKELCEKNGISKYPIWQKDGKTQPGVYTLKELAAFSGCQYP